MYDPHNTRTFPLVVTLLVQVKLTPMSCQSSKCHYDEQPFTSLQRLHSRVLRHVSEQHDDAEHKLKLSVTCHCILCVISLWSAMWQVTCLHLLLTLDCARTESCAQWAEGSA